MLGCQEVCRLGMKQDLHNKQQLMAIRAWALMLW